MKYVMATMVLALAACGGPKNRPPPSEPVSTTQTTSSALTIYQSEPMHDESSPAPIVAAKESDRNLATSIRSHLGRDKTLETVPWQRISMEVEDQHVTLRGHLPTLADSTEVERAVRGVKGVRAVKNEIRINDAYRHQ
jgi:osmotically-inducible protein OsmY